MENKRNKFLKIRKNFFRIKLSKKFIINKKWHAETDANQNENIVDTNVPVKIQLTKKNHLKAIGLQDKVQLMKKMKKMATHDSKNKPVNVENKINTIKKKPSVDDEKRKREKERKRKWREKVKANKNALIKAKLNITKNKSNTILKSKVKSVKKIINSKNTQQQRKTKSEKSLKLNNSNSKIKKSADERREYEKEKKRKWRAKIKAEKALTKAKLSGGKKIILKTSKVIKNKSYGNKIKQNNLPSDKKLLKKKIYKSVTTTSKGSKESKNKKKTSNLKSNFKNVKKFSTDKKLNSKKKKNGNAKNCKARCITIIKYKLPPKKKSKNGIKSITTQKKISKAK